MDGDLKVGDQIRQTVTRFKNMNNFEAYISSIDRDYDLEDAVLNGYIYKLDTPQFNKINRSQYGNRCDFKHEIVEHRGNNCFIPSNGIITKCVSLNVLISVQVKITNNNI